MKTQKKTSLLRQRQEKEPDGQIEREREKKQRQRRERQRWFFQFLSPSVLPAFPFCDILWIPTIPPVLGFREYKWQKPTQANLGKMVIIKYYMVIIRIDVSWNPGQVHPWAPGGPKSQAALLSLRPMVSSISVRYLGLTSFTSPCAWGWAWLLPPRRRYAFKWP